MRPLKNDDGDADLLEMFHAITNLLGEAITDEESELKVTCSLAMDEHGKESVVLCILDTADEGLTAVPIAVLLPAHGPYAQRTYAEKFNAALSRKIESDALKRVTDRIERAELERDIADEINSIIIDTTATEEPPAEYGDPLGDRPGPQGEIL